MKGFVITVLALGAAVAFFAPHTASVGESKPTSVAAIDPSAPPAKSDAPALYGAAMSLQREGDGHFYADVKVDSRDYRMLVDTGASVVALTGKDAQDMGLQWDPNDLSPVVQGANGPVMGVAVKIPDMEVGDFEAHDVQAVILPDGLAISLLGQSFLRQVPNVEIADDKLTLSD